jgi:hypothetical protein
MATLVTRPQLAVAVGNVMTVPLEMDWLVVTGKLVEFGITDTRA